MVLKCNACGSEYHRRGEFEHGWCSNVNCKRSWWRQEEKYQAKPKSKAASPAFKDPPLPPPPPPPAVPASSVASGSSSAPLPPAPPPVPPVAVKVESVEAVKPEMRTVATQTPWARVLTKSESDQVELNCKGMEEDYNKAYAIAEKWKGRCLMVEEKLNRVMRKRKAPERVPHEDDPQGAVSKDPSAASSAPLSIKQLPNPHRILRTSLGIVRS